MDLPPFSTFLAEHRVPVLRYLTAAVGPDEAADCFQETFIAALRAYPRLAPGSNLSAWVFTIAHRKVVDAARARSRRPVPVGVGAGAGTSADGHGHGEGPGHHDGHGDGLTGLAASAPPDLPPSADDPVWSAVRALPPKQRTAVVHRIVADRPYAEIAEVLGCSEDAARQSVSAGLRRLREELHR